MDTPLDPEDELDERDYEIADLRTELANCHRKIISMAQANLKQAQAELEVIKGLLEP